ncbi:MAG: P1 family peptidase [Thermomicrobiales bacterium]
MRTSTVTRRGILQGSAAAALFTTIPAAAQDDRPESGTPVTGAGPRARALGVPFLGGDTGLNNAITDVPGVGVGHLTLIEGDGPLNVGSGPVRAGVTAVVPRLTDPLSPVFAARHTLNGNGEMTGSLWIDEMGMFFGPVMLTGTYSVGTVKEAIQDFAFAQFRTEFGVAVVSETYDGLLNDAHGHHVTADHAVQAYASASDGPVAEGNVGGGTPMTCFDFKGGIGTASRVIPFPDGVSYTVGVLVQANHGIREALTIAGVPVGQEIADLLPEVSESARGTFKTSSIIVVIATDAPYLPHQLRRLAQRAGLGIGIGGGRGEDPSGDLFLAFSTTPLGDLEEPFPMPLTMLPNFTTSPFFHQVAAATEEAIVNAMVAAETMTGRDGNTVHALPHDRLQEVLQKYNRLVE